MAANHLLDVIELAQSSAAQFVLQPIADNMDLTVEELIDAIQAAVSAMTLEPTGEHLRDVMRRFAEDYALTLDMPWEDVADMILGALTWSAKSEHKGAWK